jgi:hypothetical protein
MTRETHIPTVANGTAQGTHTPGEWALGGHCLSSVIVCTVPRGHPDAKHLCGDYAVIAEFKGPNWAANARLASAAPNLYAEMLRYLPIIEAVERDPEMWQRLTVGTGIATANGYRAALSKAEGR